MEQLCGGMDAGIKRGIHVMHLLWAQNAQEDDWVLLLIDACNTSKEENQTAMLWDVQFGCPRGAQFTLICYHHWATLVVLNEDGSGYFMHSNKGVIQGGPLAIIDYGIEIFPLNPELCTVHPHVTQP